VVPPKSRVVWVLVALVLAAPAAQAAAGVEPLRPDEIGPFLDRVAAANRIYSQDMVAYQEYDVRLLIMHWHFTGRVLKTSDVAEVVLEGAPALFPKEISATLFEVADWLETFAIEYQGVESLDGHLYHRFYGTPLPGEESQTRWGTIWVDPKTFLINRIQVQYWWGRVTDPAGLPYRRRVRAPGPPTGACGPAGHPGRRALDRVPLPGASVAEEHG